MPDDQSHELALAFSYPSTAEARVVAASVGREAGDVRAAAGDRTAARVERDGATVTVSVTARDLSALRAGLNTWCGLVSTAERVLEVAEN